MPYYIPRPRLREITAPKFRNARWEQWGLKEGALGGLLAFFGLTISITEIVRVINGVTHRGLSNYQLNSGNPEFFAKNDGNLFRIGPFPNRTEKHHYWPWTYAANLFGMVAIIAGISGLVSSYRRSYSTVFVFMSLSLLSSLFGAYLIGYFSVLLSYYLSYRLQDPTRRPATMNTTWALVGFNLFVSCVITLLGAISFVVSLIGIRACSPKGLHLEETKVPYVEPAGPKGKVIATNYLG
jgi:hypothetical protein